MPTTLPPESATLPLSTSAKTVLLTVLAFMFASFTVQATSHFVVNSAHYGSISFIRSEPILPLGILVMVVQGLILGVLFPRVNRAGSIMTNAILFSLLMGLFLAAYIAIVEPSKYTVPSVTSWIVTEGVASAIQFLLFGVLLGLIHRK